MVSSQVLHPVTPPVASNVANAVPLIAHVDLVQESLVTHSGEVTVVHSGVLFLASLAISDDNLVPLMAQVDPPTPPPAPRRPLARGRRHRLVDGAGGLLAFFPFPLPPCHAGMCACWPAGARGERG